ncbi:P-loop NTPase fold protein [Limosilactobacillus reuteri]|uniref:KAP family P-loop NTPase fold protein n=1 Tax=Limosilactobacillus reuteri TaxID=1598 RepID=UPI003F26ABFC
MDKYDIEPTKVNLINSIQKDITGRNQSLENLIRLLNRQNDSWSIAINGSWGSGKTFFVKQCKLMLDSLSMESNDANTDIITTRTQLFSNEELQELQNKPFRTAYYDAWEHDNDGDPIVSILNCLAATHWSNEVKETLIKTIDIGIEIVNATAPIKLPRLRELIQHSKKQDIEKIKEQFNHVLSKLAPENGQLIIFIDELDRCKPTYAVQLLERIKHYFSNPKISFIFSVDISQLQNTIKRYYGPQFDGIQYLDRFFDLVITLPEADIEKYFDNTQGILKVDEIFGTGYNVKNNWYHSYCKELIKHFNFSIRQINHFYLRANSASYNLISKNINAPSWGEVDGEFILVTFFLPFMIALGESNIEIYQRFIKGNADSDILNIIADNRIFMEYLANMLDDKSKVSEINGTVIKEIYEGIFSDKELKDNIVKISQKCCIENPQHYKSLLINACNLLSPYVKLD